MTKRSVLVAVTIAVVLGVVGVSFMNAQQPAQPVSDKPLIEKWAPTEWGPDDKAGAVNRITPALVLKAVKLVKQGKVATLGKLYHSTIPAFGARSWNMIIPGTPTGGPFGKNALVYHDELVTTEIGQIGTQFDGPGHIGVNTSKGPMMYNGVISWDAYEHGAGGRVVGMGPLGVEHPGELGFVCRMVVLDAVAYKKSKGVIPAGAQTLPIPTKPGDPGIVTADDVRGIVQMQGLRDIAPGDCVALHTGQGNSWSNDRYKSLNSAQRKAARDLFEQGEPGFGISACEYLAARDIALTMCDTSACDAQPSGEQGPDFAVPCHTEMQTRRGIWNLENVDTKSLVDKKILEGAFIWAPLRIIGATGSPGNPLVLY